MTSRPFRDMCLYKLVSVDFHLCSIVLSSVTWQHPALFVTCPLQDPFCAEVGGAATINDDEIENLFFY